MAPRLAVASAALEIEDARKFQHLWLEGGTSEGRVMTPMLIKMSNSLKALNYQLIGLGTSPHNFRWTFLVSGFSKIISKTLRQVNSVQIRMTFSKKVAENFLRIQILTVCNGNSTVTIHEP